MAQNSQPAPAPAPQPRPARNRPTMARFGARISAVATREGTDHTIRGFGAAHTLDFLTVSNDSETVQVALTGFMSCNDPETENAQSCAFFLSGLTAIMPGLDSASKNALRFMGYAARNITVSEAPSFMIPILDWIEIPKLAVMFGQSVLILFKHITEVNYASYITQRANGLKSHAGIDELLSPSGDAVYSLERARMLRGRLGSHLELKAEILNACMANRDRPGPIGRVCNYLCDILSWNEMNYLVFIFETLCLTKSPVLSDIRVQGEVKNLYEAYVAINQTTYPQYFKILNPASASSLLMKAKFPTLITLASMIKAESQSSVTRYVSPMSTENTLVISLKTKHDAYIRTTTATTQNRHVEYLTNVDAEEEDLAAQFTNQP